MKHYICTGGCRGVAEIPGTCQTEGCPKHKQPLMVCDCRDDKHQEVYTREKSVEDHE